MTHKLLAQIPLAALEGTMELNLTAEIAPTEVVEADPTTIRDGWPQGMPSPDLPWSILATLAYADIFDFPMRAEEIHRYLIGRRASLEEIHHALETDVRLKGHIDRRGPLTFLAGRQTLEEKRRSRAETAQRLWPAAARYAGRIAELPFVRMVAVTGALALDNTDSSGDIDYLVVTAPGRVWLTRALAVLLVRLASIRGARLCPNYLLSENCLQLPDHDIYTAHELAQMIPLFGQKHYWRMRRLNQAWAGAYLPNARGLPLLPAVALPLAERRPRAQKPLTESLLGLPAIDYLERWEAARKIRRFRERAGGSLQTEERFSLEWCKGHFDHHAGSTLKAFSQRLKDLGEGWR